MEIKTIILNEERQKEAIEHGFDSWESFSAVPAPNTLLLAENAAYEKALDLLDAVYRWASLNGWKLRGLKDEPRQWFKYHESAGENTWTSFLTDSELYQLFKQQNP